MYQFKEISTESYTIEFGDNLKSPIYSKPWLEFIRSWRGLSPVVIQVSMNSREIGYLCGFSKTILGIRLFGSPLPGCVLPNMGFNIYDPDSVNYPLLLKEAFVFLKKVCRYHYISICDTRHTNDLLSKCEFKFDCVARETYVLDIDKPIEEIKKGFSKSYRNYINFFEKKEGVISEDYSDSLIMNHNSQLVDVYDRDGESSPDIINKYRLLFDQCVDNKMVLCVKADIPSKKDIGSSIYLYGGEWAYFLTNATYSENLNDRPNQSLMWYALKYFHGCGVKKVDLVGPGEYKKYYGGEHIVFYDVIVSKYGLHKLITFARKAYIACVKNNLTNKLVKVFVK